MHHGRIYPGSLLRASFYAQIASSEKRKYPLGIPLYPKSVDKKEESMRLVSIASGSSGNCIYVGSDTTHILVDAGISNKRIQQGLNEIGLKVS